MGGQQETKTRGDDQDEGQDRVAVWAPKRRNPPAMGGKQEARKDSDSRKVDGNNVDEDEGTTHVLCRVSQWKRRSRVWRPVQNW